MQKVLLLCSLCLLGFSSLSALELEVTAAVGIKQRHIQLQAQKMGAYYSAFLGMPAEVLGPIQERFQWSHLYSQHLNLAATAYFEPWYSRVYAQYAWIQKGWKQASQMVAYYPLYNQTETRAAHRSTPRSGAEQTLGWELGRHFILQPRWQLTPLLGYAYHHSCLLSLQSFCFKSHLYGPFLGLAAHYQIAPCCHAFIKSSYYFLPQMQLAFFDDLEMPDYTHASEKYRFHQLRSRSNWWQQEIGIAYQIANAGYLSVELTYERKTFYFAKLSSHEKNLGGYNTSAIYSGQAKWREQAWSGQISFTLLF